MANATLTDFYTFMSKQKLKEEQLSMYNRRYGNVIGEKHGKLEIVEILNTCSREKGVRVKCLCDCGEHKKTFLTYLRSRLVKSCGCIRSRGPGTFAIKQ